MSVECIIMIILKLRMTVSLLPRLITFISHIFRFFADNKNENRAKGEIYMKATGIVRRIDD